MKAAKQTQIFGVRIGLDPKVLVGILIVLAGLLFWYNSRGDDPVPAAALPPPAKTETAGTIADSPAPTPGVTGAARKITSRRAVRVSDNGILKLRPIDPTKGDVDPTLHLDLLARVQRVQSAGTTRNLFDVGPSPVETAALMKPIKGPVVVPRPLPTGPVNPVLPGQSAVDIPFKFYGFMRPAEKGQTNRGLFLDGDNILVASEGELLKQRYLVVELTANSARMEDTHLKQGQTLSVVPEAKPESN